MCRKDKDTMNIDMILASASPRRKEILEQAGMAFRVVVSHADENVSEKDPARLVEELSRRKGGAVAEMLSGTHLIIGSDTVVVLDGKVLGKPSDERDAFSMLKSLSGRTHQVITGVSLILIRDGRTQRECVFHEVTDVAVRPLSDEEIHGYIKTGDPMDKAGSYGIQGMAGMFISGIRGDYYNVVGLPLCRTVVEIRRMLDEEESCKEGK